MQQTRFMKKHLLALLLLLLLILKSYSQCLLTTTITPANPAICIGSGISLYANTSGGTGPYFFSWSTGGTTGSISVAPSATTTYSVTVKDISSGCTSTASTTVTVNTPPMPSASASASPSTICEGSSSTLSATGSGGTPPYTYNWYMGSSSSPASVSVFPASTTTYFASVTDKNGCSSALTTTVVTVNNGPSFAGVTTTSVTCYGGNNGSITVGARGGSGTYTYSDNGTTYQTSNVFNNLIGGYNEVYVKDAGGNGCTSSELVYIYQPTKLTVGTTSSSSTVCAGGSSTITANPSGGTGPYSYSWSTGATTSSITVSPSTTTTYSVTVTDACSAKATASATITYSTAVVSTPTITASGPTIFCGGKNVELIASDATSGVSYQWYKNGSILNGYYGSTYYASAAGSYTVQASTTPGCVANSAPTAITILPTPAPTIVKSFIYNSCSTNTAILSIHDTSTASNLSYQWGTFDTPTSLDFSGATNSTYTTTESAWYIVAVTNNASGCSAQSLWDTINITPSPELDVSSSAYTTNATICPGQSTNFNNYTQGNGPLTYSWSPSTGLNSSTIAAPTASPSATTSYTLTVTDVNGCSSSATITVNVNPVKPTITTAYGSAKGICPGEGSVNLVVGNNSSGVNYKWYNNGIFITGATSYSYTTTTTGKYTVTSTDCSITDTSAPFTVTTGTNPAVPTITKSTNNAICTGDNVNFAVNDTSTNISYQWLLGGGYISGATNAAYIATSPGIYNVQIAYNTTGCYATSKTDTINTAPSPATPAITASSPTIPCSGSADTLKANVISGATYQWYNGSTAISGATNVQYITSSVGTYSVTATNSNGCSASSPPTTITTSQGPSVSVPSPLLICKGDTATLTTNVTGASPFIYSWSTGATSSSITVSPDSLTLYIVTVTDANGCSSSPDTVSTLVTQPSVVINGLSFLCPQSTDTLYAVTSSNVAAYQWYNGNKPTSITSKYFINSGGIYSLTVTDIMGCTATDSLTVVQPAAISTTFTRSNDTLYIHASPSGQYNYDWVYNGQLVSYDSSLIFNYSGDYTATVIYANNCSVSSVYTVNSDTIHGQVNGSDDANTKVYLLKLNSDSALQVVDSANIINGTFTLESIYSPVYIYYVPDSSANPSHIPSYYNSVGDTTVLFNGASPITLPLTVNNITITNIVGTDSGGTGIISGVITLPDSNSNFRTISAIAASGIKIILMDSLNKPVQVFITDPSGNFYFSRLQPGSYYLMADKPFFPNMNPPIISLSPVNNNSSNQQFILTKTSLERVGGVTSVIQPTTSIDVIKVYPNPAKDIVYISTGNNQNNSFSYRLSDMAGKVLKNGVGNSSISLSGIENGVYIISIQTTTAIIYTKLVVE